MASFRSERERELRVVWIPTIPPLSSDELDERLASLLQLQGDTLESFKTKLSARGLTWKSVGINHNGSAATPPESHVSPTSSPRCSIEHSPKTTTATMKSEGRNFDPERVTSMKTGVPIPIPGPGPAVEIDAVLAASMGDLIVGHEAPPNMQFCPWRMAQNYPDWFIGKANAPRARPFFNDFHTHQMWHFYYLYSPSPHYLGPFIFVPRDQFTRFLRIVNSQLDTKLAIPEAHANRFSYRFGDGDTPRPRYLGKVHDAKSSTRLLDGKAWPACGQETMKYAEARSTARDQVRQRLDDIAKYLPAKKKKSSAIKQARNREMRRAMMAKLQDALGIKPWETASVVSKDSSFAIDKAPVFLPKRAPVFVSIDVEVNEFCQDMVTEVGFAILDTERTKNIAPGELGEAWWSSIESKHLRIKEYAFHRNHKFVNGCPDRFDFGSSDFVPKKQLLKEIDSIFAQYATRTLPTGERIERDIVLVGHDVGSDDKFLLSIGYKLTTKNIIFRADSKDLHQHLRSADQGRGLAFVLFDFGIHAANLHNAGNDATYTLRAAIACAIEDMKEQARPRQKPEEKQGVDETGNVSEGSGYEDKQDVTWVPGKTYYYADDTDDENLPIVM